MDLIRVRNDPCLRRIMYTFLYFKVINTMNDVAKPGHYKPSHWREASGEKDWRGGIETSPTVKMKLAALSSREDVRAQHPPMTQDSTTAQGRASSSKLS